MKLEYIENAIYEAIRLKIVEKGYLPDITAYAGNPEGYQTAINNIKASGKKIVYVENTGSYKGREDLEENCIIVDNDDFRPSATGTKSIPIYELNETEDKYNKSLSTDGIYDLEYKVTLVCYDIEYLQLMHDIVLEALRFRKKLKALNSAAEDIGEWFLLWRRNYIVLDSKKFMERAVYYEVPSVDIEGCTPDGQVARAEEITVGVSTNKDIEKDDEDDISDEV